MKLKKLLISTSIVAASSGLLATVLTSCAKANVEDKYKVTLDDQGKFVSNNGLTFTFAEAIKNALGRSASWTGFKTALAEELVFQWYQDRASKDKNDETKNVDFRSNLDEWKYDIDKDYDDVVDACKSKYGSNYKFYLQNEYLSANGGTEESYKHAKLVEKVKSEFITKVFANNYFSYATEAPKTDYPHIFTKASTKIDDLKLRNPESWERLGFYAKSNANFDVDDATDPNLLAAKPDGDYAIIQDYTFNRWYKTEKPFFSAASLFKYSKPNESGGELKNIYNPNKATVPSDPNEAFPFFGGVSVENGSTTGTNLFYQWLEAFDKGAFEASGLYKVDNVEYYNGTMSIPTKYSEDGQTLLLCSATQMFAGSSGALYTPYAISAASLYEQMFRDTPTRPMNTITPEFLRINAYNDGGSTQFRPQGADDARILRNFFYNKTTFQTLGTISSFLNLDRIYGGATGETAYHCPLFLKPDDRTSTYDFFYGENGGAFGVQYITNNVQVNGLVPTGTHKGIAQPWVLELNEAGVHAQTIDGYQIIKTSPSKDETLKQLIKYRLMQKMQGYDGGMISADLLGDNGKLKTYFSDNFADIVIEMAMSSANETNIFRKIETYKDGETTTDENLFLKVVCDDQLLGSIENLREYITTIFDFDQRKRIHEAINAANEKVYSYRTAQIQNSKNNIGKKIFENGLLAPIAATYQVPPMSLFSVHYMYTPVASVMPTVPTFPGGGSQEYDINDLGSQKLDTDSKAIYDLAFIKSIDAKVDQTTSGFSPQISEAKKVQSNRFWFRSSLVDKVLYTYMSSNNIANGIKVESFKKYETNSFPDGGDYNFTSVQNGTKNSKVTTYIANKLLTGDKNYASYAPRGGESNYFTNMNNAYTGYSYEKTFVGGEYCDETLALETYNATLAYLSKNNFENFYKSLNTKISEDEMAFVGYVAKYNANYTDTEIGYTRAAPMVSLTNNPYIWSPFVDNIFDQVGYKGGQGITSGFENAHVASDQYWHVIPQANASNYAGFTGIQSKSSNQLDSDSGLQSAVFDQFARSTQNTPDWTQGGVVAHDQNDGVLFAWAGEKDGTGQSAKQYTFDDVADPRSTPEATITAANFATVLPAGLKLARKIANCSTLDDLRTLARALGNAIDGNTIFREIGNGTYHIETETAAVQEVKYVMLNEFYSNATDYAPYFERLVNAEVHTDPAAGNEYCFESGSNGYRLMLTQINKSDIIEQKITPTFDESVWTMPEGAGLQLEEFWYIISSMACEASIQQLAIADTVKALYGEDKLQIHDAQLYNQFDSVWIKDWEKKPIGGEGA